MVTRNQILFALFGLIALAALFAGAWRYKQLKEEESNRAEQEQDRRSKPRVLSEYAPLLDKVTVVNTDSALGHRLTIQSENGSRYLVSLYFVECPPVEANELTNATLARLARYFGNVPLEKVIEGGVAARELSLKQLATRPFRLATLFRPTKTVSGIWGFILLRAEDDTEEYLSELLVRDGLAAISAEGAHLPYGEPASEFRNFLIGLEKEARAAKRGIWAFSRNPDEGGAPPELPPSR